MDLAGREQDDRNRLLILISGGFALLLATVLAYFPGLAGPFVLDDVLTIAALGDHGGVSNWASFKAFVFDGHSGPTGRPVSQLTFLIDATNWPADPYSFKRTNLIIHLLTGATLGVLIYYVLRTLTYQKNRARWIALTCVAAWLLHPFLVSTTLYVVQRMAQLSAMFVFAGLAGYLYGRSLVTTNARKAYVVMSTSLLLFTILATFSKENGILLPLLAGVLEVTIVASQRLRLGQTNRYWNAVFLVVPAAVVIGFLLSRAIAGGFFDLAVSRDFSIYERLMTESRVLVDYLRHWFVPSLYTPGVYQDHFLKSSGWLSPVTTLLSTLFHVVVISAAIYYRRKRPLLALAALFFYVAHLLESTVMNLELYFEHRNYLATAFLFLPVVVTLINRLKGRTAVVVIASLILVLGGFTRYSSTIWSDYARMVEASAKAAPKSVRAQARYATILFDTQRYEESLQVLDQAITDIPGHHSDLLVNRLFIMCNLGILNEADFRRSASGLQGLYFNPGKFFLYRAFVTAVAEGRCPALPVASLRPLFVAMIDVPLNSNTENLPFSQLNYLIGFIDVHSGNPAAAKEAFARSLQADSSAFAALRMAGVFAANEFYDAALDFSARALTELRVEQQGGLGSAGVTEAGIREFEAAVIAARDAPPVDGIADQDQ